MSAPTVLLVEDEDLLREGIEEVLEFNGYRVMTASNGEQALECLEHNTVNLIITDLVMPTMNGVEFIGRVREKRPELPIVVASGSPGAVMKRLGIDTIHVPGATVSIMKPFKSNDLLALVKQVLTPGDATSAGTAA